MPEPAGREAPLPSPAHSTHRALQRPLRNPPISPARSTHRAPRTESKLVLIPKSILIVFNEIHIFHYHQRDLKRNRIFKHTQIQPGALLQLIQTVDQGVSVDIKLSGCLGYIQAVFKKFIDCGKCFLIKADPVIITGKISLINMRHRGMRQLIDQTADTQSGCMPQYAVSL